jgi:serine palmitoyltransferase
LVSDFDDFYTRRLYHRIEECWNRPISSCPAPVTTMMIRSRSAYGQPYEVTGEHRHVLNLGSYNYLGFGDPNSPTREAVFASLERYGISTTSTRVNMGTTLLHAELEEVTARFVGKEAAMIFGMGFGTNSTGIPALAGKGGLIISDSNNHASIAVGARTSGAVIRVFKHNDMRSLEAVLRHAIVSGQPKSHRPWTKILILVEGIYSMEGEMAPLPEIVALKKKYGAYLFVDEAHSIGAIGANGRGICEYAGVDPRDVDVLMGTFTKSFGAVGGYIAADRDVIEFLRANSAGSVYSSSISPPAVQQVLSAFRIMMHEDGTTIGRRKLDTLRENSNYFRSRLNEMGCHTLGDWDSPIVLLMLYHPAKITAFSTECLRRGLAIVVVGFPATPLLLARVRFCLSAGHTKEQLDFALRQIEDVVDQIGVKYAI